MVGPYRPDIVRVKEMADWEHVANATCSICGCKYSAHQPVPGFTWLHKLCDGNLVKL